MVFSGILNSIQGVLPALPTTLLDFDSASPSLPSASDHTREKVQREQTELALKNAPTQDAYIQILAQKASSCNFQDNHLLPKSEHFNCPTYQVQKTIAYPQGIKAIVVISDQASEPPLIAFRGTDTSNPSNVIDDLNVNIGEINCKTYSKELREELELLHKKHGRIHLTGHSYGGTVAQRLTAE